MSATYSALTKLLRDGQPVSLATIVTSHVAGIERGDKLLLPQAGEAAGSIHPQLDAQIARDAAGLLTRERSEIITYEVAGDALEVFIESFPPPQQLIVVGAVHVAIPLCQMAHTLGFRVVVVDPRSAFATEDRFPAAWRIIVEWPQEAFPQFSLTQSTSVVALTHDPRIDLPALHLALGSPVRYVGMIGSKATVAERKTALLEMGVTEAQLELLHAPIGLNIGARTPAEIALSILCEIVAVRRGR